MSKDDQPRRKPGGNKGKKYESPLSLYPLSFDKALIRLLAHRPKRDPDKKAQK